MLWWIFFMLCRTRATGSQAHWPATSCWETNILPNFLCDPNHNIECVHRWAEAAKKPVGSWSTAALIYDTHKHSTPTSGQKLLMKLAACELQHQDMKRVQHTAQGCLLYGRFPIQLISMRYSMRQTWKIHNIHVRVWVWLGMHGEKMNVVQDNVCWYYPCVWKNVFLSFLPKTRRN